MNLAVHGADTLLDPLLQLGDEQLVILLGPGVAAQDHGRPHVDRAVEEGQRRGSLLGQAQHPLPEQRAAVGGGHRLAQPVHVQLVSGDPLQLGDQGPVLAGDVADDLGGQLAHAARGLDADLRHVELALVEGEPVLHVAALVGVVDQHVGAGDLLHAESLGQRRFLAQVGADVAGQVGADVRRVADRVGHRDQVGRHPRRAEQGAVVLGEVDLEPEGAQQLGGPDAGAPGDLGAAGPRCLVELGEILAHQLPHRAGGLDLLDDGRLLAHGATSCDGGRQGPCREEDPNPVGEAGLTVRGLVIRKLTRR